ncbi:MAG: methionine adenosyltransferase [candidate division WS1 bacterium]|nr:methionine adenosyltransferase [candidate division WS1 bacterium]
MPKSYFLTSESVTEGHPDKVCDQVSDAILDAVLADDPLGRVAIETLVTTGTCFVAGEMHTETYVPIESVVRQVVSDIGYTRAKYGFDFETMGVLLAIHEQSSEIAQGVVVGGAGDQGMMFGYATNETPEGMPLPILLAHRLARRLAEVRKNGTLPYLRPDGKTQVTVRYEDEKPIEVTKVLLAAQHAPSTTRDEMEEDIREHVVYPVILDELRAEGMPILLNRTGSFSMGGPQVDTGLTGRKIIVDTYGGLARHGGGAFSGKDPTKVDRSGAYMARYIAKNIVFAGLADKCEVQIAYAIGDAEPFSVAAWTFGTHKVPEETIAKLIPEVFPLTPQGMIDHLNLRRPIYKKTAAYGHFGRNDPDFTWEATDMIDAVRAAAQV